MLFRKRSWGFKPLGLFKSYITLGIAILTMVFFLYSNWVSARLKQETAEFSKMLATFVAQLPAIADKETSDAARKIIEELKFPFIIVYEDNEPIVARGIGKGLREKIQARTLTPADRDEIENIIKEMDKNHTPISVKGIVGSSDEGRKIIGYFYYNQTKWALNHTSPIVVTDTSEEPIFWHNMVSSKSEEELKAELRLFIQEAKNRGFLTTIQYNPSSQKAYLHYGNTELMQIIKWWMPVGQALMVAGFLIVMLWAYQRIKHNEQQAIWAGLAKETAHQLGTPISSLMGWVDVLQERTENVDEETATIYREMQGDLERLNNITSRFGEVGSLPKLEYLDVSNIIHRAVVYFQKRLPNRQKHVEITESHQNVPKVRANENLLQWVIENLIRNSLDAIDRENGRIEIKTEYDYKKKHVLITYKDNGKGIPRRTRLKVFLPGYSTKKHGWGLGLAIVKRIIEGYHGGNIKLAESGSEGSTFEIRLPAGF